MSLNDTPDQRALLGQEVDDQPMGPSMLEMMAQAPPTQAPVRAIQGQGSNPMGGGGLDPQMLAQLLSGPTETQRMGQALAGGVAFMRGQPNPVTTMLEEQRRESQGIVSMLSQLQERHDRERDRQARIDLETRRITDAEKSRADDKLKGSIELSRSLINNPNASPTMIARGTQDLQKAAGQLYGSTIPDSIITPQISKEDKDELFKDVFRVAKKDPQGNLLPLDPGQVQWVSQFHKKIPPDQIASVVQVLNTPGMAEDLGLMTTGKLSDIETKRKITQLDLIEKSIPREFKDPKWGTLVSVTATKLYPGTDYQDLSPDQRARIFEITRQQEDQRTLREHEQKIALDLQKGMQLSQFTHGLDLQNFQAKEALKQNMKNVKTLAESGEVFTNTNGELAKPEWTPQEAGREGYFRIQPKELDGLKSGAMALQQLQNIKDTISTVEKSGLTVESNSVMGTLFQKGNIARRQFGEREARTALVNLESQKAELINVLRQAGDNARAAILLIPVIQTLSPASGAEGMRQAMSNVESAIRASGERSRTPGLFTKVPRIFTPVHNPLTGGEVDEDGIAPGIRVK